MRHRGASVDRASPSCQPISIPFSEYCSIAALWRSGHVTIADVAAAAGVSVATVSKVINDRYGVAEQTSARVRAVIERARLHVEPRRAEPAQSPLERDRRHHRGHRALQRRAAQGRRTGDPRHRLRPRRLLRLRSPRGPGRLGAALARAGQRPHRRLDPGHAQQRRCDTCRAARRRRPQRALLDAPDGGLRQPQGRGRGDRAPDRARPPAYRLPRGTPRPRVRAAPRAGLPRRAGGGRHPVRPRLWSASAATGPTPRPRPPATSWGAKDGRRRSSLRTTRRRSRR